MCGSKFFMEGHGEVKKVYLAKFQNSYYINPKKMGGHRPPRPPSTKIGQIMIAKLYYYLGMSLTRHAFEGSNELVPSDVSARHIFNERSTCVHKIRPGPSNHIFGNVG